ncbi:hypothetical protein [Pseudomonas ovata]|uniref:hypothetical protein n=1 Tax=Pseudomonas ovata TaxID=1839709 RepID=UPI000D6940E8|nr:hypothetical protein [Pseudomonas ovata]
MSIKRLFTAALLGALLGGCVEYRHVPPATAEGQQCVEQCSGQQAACVDKAQHSVQDDQAFYNWQMTNYRSCMSNMSGEGTWKYACGGEPSSPSRPDTRHCTSSYDSCFTRCGGRIEKVPRQ